LDYVEKENTIPKPLAFSLACLIEYYKTQTPQDNENVVAFIKNNDLLAILSNQQLWGHDLSCLYDVVYESIDKIQKTCIREAISWAIM
jgi:mannitol-1-phosphate/altronate dehydrogenase